MKSVGKAVLLAVAAVAGAGPALAVDEIIVTAQRREERLQDVPLAVSAFDAAAITSRQIDVVKNIGQNVPNLQTYTVTAGNQAMQVHSRGASVQNPGFNASESPVGIYQDDVYFGRLASANLDLADIERIEVLRGPQGTLYGRNTIAGAIKIISRTPGNDSWLNASAGYGNYDTWQLAGSAGGPIEPDALAGSVAMVYNKRDRGWQENSNTGDRPGEHENLVVRSKLHWYGSENFDGVLSVWAADLENDGWNGVPYASPPDANGRETGGPLGISFYDSPSAAGVNYGDSNQAGASLKLEFDLGEVTLRSISAFNSIDDKFGFDLSGGGGIGVDKGNNGLLTASDSTMDTISQELQLLGTAFGGRLDWLAGLYYQNEDGEQTYSGNLTIPNFGPPPPATITLFDFTENIATDTDSYAAFAEGTWHFNDRLSVVAGGRWTEDKKDYDNACTGPTCLGGPVTLDESFDEFTGKLGVNYKLSDAALIYLTYAQGFQAGGFQTLCFGDLTTDCAGTFYDPQTVDSVEFGLKSDWLDRTVQLNVAGFYAMYDDIQQTGLVGGKFPIVNVGEVDVYGAEAELNWTPIESINVYGFLGWQESDYGTLNPDATATLTGADELPSNPKYNGKLGFNYTLDVSQMVETFYGLELYFTDEYYSTVDNSLLIGSYSRVNGFIGIGDPDKSWQLVLTGRNITDQEDNVSGIYYANVTNVRTVQPPAEFMLTFKVNY